MKRRKLLLDLLQMFLEAGETDEHQSVGALMESLRPVVIVNENVKDGLYIMDGMGNIVKLAARDDVQVSPDQIPTS